MAIIGNIGGAAAVPSQIISGLSNYTIPADKYALVTMYVWSNSSAKATEGTGAGQSATSSSDSASQWVKEGTSIVASSSAGGANGSATVTIDGGIALEVKTRITTLASSPSADSIAGAGFTVALYDIA
jgi:hypothetical protein